MAEKASFDLSDFLAERDRQIEVPVFIPGGPFRIHPDEDRVVGPVYLCCTPNEGWVMVSREVVNTVRVPNLWQADLYEGVLPDGSTFLLPVTHPKNGRVDWFSTMMEAIELARSEWVSVESNKSQCRFMITPEGKKRAEPQAWMDCTMVELVEVAFFDRTVENVEEAEKSFPKRAKRVVWDEVEE